MRHINLLTIMLLATALLIGCGKQEEKKPAKPVTQDNTEGAEHAEPERLEIDADVRGEVESKLAEADKLDGTSDKVVHRCASCELGMDGKSEYALEVMDYTLHFCTEHCKKSFAKDVTQSLLDLKIPEE